MLALPFFFLDSIVIVSMSLIGQIVYNLNLYSVLEEDFMLAIASSGTTYKGISYSIHQASDTTSAPINQSYEESYGPVVFSITF